MLDEARANLTRIMAQMAPALESALPIVVLEPSCLSVFRDELPALFPNDQRASQLSGAVQTFAEFLVKENVTLPLFSQVPHIHGHCHQKACGGMAGEATLLKQLGMGHLIESGCCGMAGAYGYNAKTAEIGEKIGREQWAPRLSNVPETDALIADGFSCRSQASNLTGRRPLHIAEWLAQIVRSSDPTS
jgi:Fe-S oxidoreductase